MAKRTKEERIADRAKARAAAGKTLSKRQQQASNNSNASNNTPKVKENRDAAKAAGQTMKQYKAANNISPKYTSQQRQSTANQTEGNISTYDASSVGAKNEKYSHNDIKALKSQGYSKKDIGKHLNSLGEDANFGGAAKRLRDKYVAGLTATPPNEEQTITPLPSPAPEEDRYATPTPTPAPTPTPVTNPVTSKPVVDPGTGLPDPEKLYETPVTDRTLDGYYDVDDSPEASKERYDTWVGLNRESHKRYAGMGMDVANQFSQYDARDYSPQALQQAIYDSMQNSYDRADVQTGITLGDIWRSDFAPEWRMPAAPKPIESNIGDIADDAKDEIEDM